MVKWYFTRTSKNCLTCEQVLLVLTDEQVLFHAWAKYVRRMSTLLVCRMSKLCLTHEQGLIDASMSTVLFDAQASFDQSRSAVLFDARACCVRHLRYVTRDA